MHFENCRDLLKAIQKRVEHIGILQYFGKDNALGHVKLSRKFHSVALNLKS